MGPRQQRQERLRNAICAEEVDSEVFLQQRTVAQVVIQGDARVIDEDVDRLDAIDGTLDLG